MSKKFGAFCLALGLTLPSYFTASAQADSASPTTAQQAPPGKWVILLHGRATSLQHGSLTPEKEKSYRAALELATQAAARVLNANGSAISAVEAGLLVLEDDPQFAATRTSGLEASIMDGSTTKSGSVIGVKTTKHPISLAKAVLSKSQNRSLSGEEADQFATKQGLTQIPASSFVEDTSDGGTLGMVVRDRMGDLAAGTTGKSAASAANDLPLLTEETYASNRSCAVSSTGTGEAFLKLQVARSICALVQYTGLNLQQAEDEVVQRQLSGLKGEGGVIAITADGQLAWSFNTQAMFRVRLVEGRAEQIGIYKNEP
ncbi:isoaspartyl peptidase/L-asparaginase family protein [Granulicella paludicola]|uniref:isoaspartyl peptidase/L-asparaginase family protein n=1 Tax=Granulicella paludicola TaxID=474951 RepID=UPI0021E0791E|nr:isoaspartyl peptidase/L-asparaginase [Granulicella paludicola]